MKIEFTLTEQDLLTHQLFATSKARRVVKRRAQGKIFLLLIYMATGIFIWERNGVITGAVFFLVCLPLYFLYAAMERKQYSKHIGAFVTEHTNRNGRWR
jgi:cobalamin biosynthesis protein CobD/CbiB